MLLNDHLTYLNHEERTALLAVGAWIEHHSGDGPLSKKVQRSMKKVRRSYKARGISGIKE